MQTLMLMGVAMPGGGCAEEPRGIDEILDAHREEIMATPGVTGVGRGLCEGEPCIKVYVEAPGPDLAEELGDLLGESRYVIVTSGEFHALPEKDG